MGTFYYAEIIPQRSFFIIFIFKLVAHIFRRQRQVDLTEFEASLLCRVSSRTARAIQSPVSNNHEESAFFIYYFYFICVCVLPAYICTVCVQCLWRPEEGIGYCGTGLNDSCELTGGCEPWSSGRAVRALNSRAISSVQKLKRSNYFKIGQILLSVRFLYS